MPGEDVDLVELRVRLPRDLVIQCLEVVPDEPFEVRHHPEAVLLLRALCIATMPPDPAEHLYDLQQQEADRHKRAAEREQYRLDAARFDLATLDRFYPPSRLCAMWVATEREDRQRPPVEPWERRPLAHIRAHALELETKRRRGIEAARAMLEVR